MPANVSVLYDAPHTEVRRMYQGAFWQCVGDQPAPMMRSLVLIVRVNDSS